MHLLTVGFLSAVTVDKPTGVLGALATGAEDFIKVFNKGGSVLLSLMGGILPTLVVLLTAVNALVRIIGAERIENLGRQENKRLCKAATTYFFPENLGNPSAQQTVLMEYEVALNSAESNKWYVSLVIKDMSSLQKFNELGLKTEEDTLKHAGF